MQGAVPFGTVETTLEAPQSTPGLHAMSESVDTIDLAALQSTIITLFDGNCFQKCENVAIVSTATDIFLSVSTLTCSRVPNLHQLRS